MIYRTGTDFRRALEDRLLAQSNRTSGSLVRLRKLVAFDRFLARLVQAQPGAWMLKGGLALQLRMGSHARTTKDCTSMGESGFSGHRLSSPALSTVTISLPSGVNSMVLISLL